MEICITFLNITDKQLKLTKSALENYAMVFMTLGIDKDGNWQMDLDKAKEFWRNLDSVLPDEIGSVLTPMPINKISFEKSHTSNTNTVAEAEEELFRELSKDYISGLTLTGGDPLHENNLDGVLNLVNKIRLLLPDKTIWLYTGYDFNNLMHWTEEQYEIDVHNNFRLIKSECLRQAIICQCDVVVDGRYIDSQRNISLKWRGSTNQNVVDVKKSLRQSKKVLYCD